MLCSPGCSPGDAGSVTQSDDGPASTALEELRLRLDKMEQELMLVHAELDTKVTNAEVSQPEQDLAHPAEKDSGVQLEVEDEDLQQKSTVKMPEENADCKECQEEEPESMTDRERLEHTIIKKRELHRDHVQEKIRKQLRYFQQQGLSDNDGDKETNLTQAQRNSIDEDWFMKEYTKQEICNCKNATEIIIKAELLIDENWLDKIDALPGNLFSVGAFGEIFDRASSLFSKDGLKVYSKTIGCCLVILIQLIGPPLIFFSRMPTHIGVVEDSRYEWGCHPLVGAGNSSVQCPSGKLSDKVGIMDDWQRIFMTKFLGIIFIIAFILNGLFSIMDEQKTWKNLYNTFRFLDWKNEEFKAPGGVYLFFGAFVNCWVVLWSCLDMYVVAGACADPQDLLMDALALLFLFNLDDVGGDLCFVDEDDWPGLRIAWIYQELVHPWPDDEFDEDKLDALGFASMLLYRGTITLLFLELAFIPVLVIITPFLDIAPSD